MTPPSLDDGDGWPFKLLCRVPYRPDNHNDWRDGILEGLGLSAVERAGLRSPFHDAINTDAREQDHGPR